MKIRYIYIIKSRTVFRNIEGTPILELFLKRLRNAYGESWDISIFSAISLSDSEIEKTKIISEKFSAEYFFLKNDSDLELYSLIADIPENNYDFIMFCNSPGTIIMDDDLYSSALKICRQNGKKINTYHFLKDGHFILSGNAVSIIKNTSIEYPSKKNKKGGYIFLMEAFSDSVNDITVDLMTEIYGIEFTKENSDLFTNNPMNSVGALNIGSLNYLNELMLKCGKKYHNLTFKDIGWQIISNPNTFYLESLCLEVSADCNLKCGYCPREYYMPEIANRPKYMPDEIINSILSKTQQITDLEFRVNFMGMGEPLLHPGIEKLISDFQDNFEKCEIPSIKSLTIYTNGTNLTENIIELIKTKYYVNILFNLDFNSREEYQSGKKADLYDRVLENINSLSKAKKQIFINSENNVFKFPTAAVVSHLIDEKEIDGTLKFMKNWMEFQKIMRTDPIYSSSPSTAMYNTYKKVDRFIEHAVLRGYSDFAKQLPVLNVPDYTPIKRFACHRILKSINILTNGTITLCDRDFNGKIKFGNIKDYSSFEEAVTQSGIREYRLKHIRERYCDIDICNKCRDWYIPVE